MDLVEHRVGACASADAGTVKRVSLGDVLLESPATADEPDLPVLEDATRCVLVKPEFGSSF